MRIFLSYRRSDVGGHAGRLSDALMKRLGAGNLFQDVTHITAGQDFAAAITTALDRCDAALAVIGPGWVTAATADGRRRLFEPDDYVRLELATVLRKDLPVAPVLVGGASLPAAEELPEELRPLVRRQAIALRDENWHQDVDNLVRSLRGETAATSQSRYRRSVVLMGALALVLIVGVALWRPWAGEPTDDGRSTQEGLPECPDTVGEGWTQLPLSVDPSGRREEATGELVFTVRRASWRALATGQWQIIVEADMHNRTSESWYHAASKYDSLMVAQRRFSPTCFDAMQPLVIPNTIASGRSGYVVTCEPTGFIALRLEDGRATIALTDVGQPSPC